MILLLATGLTVGVRTLAFEAYSVPSGSMLPTLQIGDRIIVDKFLFHASSLRRGAIVVFHRPAADTVCGTDEAVFVKRIIGLPGQTVSSSAGRVLINGKPVAEPYLPVPDPLVPPIATIRLPRGEYYVLGDDRNDSCDSRYWGPIRGSSIIGRVVLVWWRHGRPAFHVL